MSANDASSSFVIGQRVGIVNPLIKRPFIKGEYLGSKNGIATIKMDWKLATGEPAVAHTGLANVVSVDEPTAGSRVGLVNSITKRPFIQGNFVKNHNGIATIKMDWKLATGQPAMAYTGIKNVVATDEIAPGTRVGLVNSITKRPFIHGEYVSSHNGIATIKMDWRLATGERAVAHTSLQNVVATETPDDDDNDVPPCLEDSQTTNVAPDDAKSVEQLRKEVSAKLIARLKNAAASQDNKVLLEELNQETKTLLKELESAAKSGDQGQIRQLKAEISVRAEMLRVLQSSILSFTVPQGAKPGSIVNIQLPSGQITQLKLPENAKPGQKIRVQVRHKPKDNLGTTDNSTLENASTPSMKQPSSGHNTNAHAKGNKSESGEKGTSGKTKKTGKSKRKKKRKKRNAKRQSESQVFSPWANVAIGLAAVGAFAAAGALFIAATRKRSSRQ